MDQRITDWLEEKTGATRRQMALKIGQTPSTFYRNIDTAEMVTAVCRAYGINPAEGLVAADIITEREVVAAAEKTRLKSVGERALVEEMLRRIDLREQCEADQPQRQT